MGAPFDGDWADVAGAYFVGSGGSDAIWLFISIALCLLAMVVGGRHEKHAYEKAQK